MSWEYLNQRKKLYTYYEIVNLCYLLRSKLFNSFYRYCFMLSPCSVITVTVIFPPTIIYLSIRVQHKWVKTTLHLANIPVKGETSQFFLIFYFLHFLLHFLHYYPGYICVAHPTDHTCMWQATNLMKQFSRHVPGDKGSFDKEETFNEQVCRDHGWLPIRDQILRVLNAEFKHLLSTHAYLNIFL